jgi:hypothetical protein
MLLSGRSSLAGAPGWEPWAQDSVRESSRAGGGGAENDSAPVECVSTGARGTARCRVPVSARRSAHGVGTGWVATVVTARLLVTGWPQMLS